MISGAASMHRHLSASAEQILRLRAVGGPFPAAQVDVASRRRPLADRIDVRPVAAHPVLRGSQSGRQIATGELH
jgi:hypothetical protein